MPKKHYSEHRKATAQKRATKEHVEKRSGETNVDITVTTEENGSGNTRHSWMETDDLWPMLQ